MFGNLNWQIVGEIVALLTFLGKGVHWIYSKFKEKDEQISKLKEENELLKILNAKQTSVLKMTSEVLKGNLTEGLDDAIDDITDK